MLFTPPSHVGEAATSSKAAPLAQATSASRSVGVNAGAPGGGIAAVWSDDAIAARLAVAVSTVVNLGAMLAWQEAHLRIAMSAVAAGSDGALAAHASRDVVDAAASAVAAWRKESV